MIKVFIPQTKEKKSSIRGLWKSGSGQLFYDYLKQVNFSFILTQADFEKIRIQYKQEALFFIDTQTDSAFIFSGINKIETLKMRKTLSFDKTEKKLFKEAIKKLLSLYNGCTIYSSKYFYFLESWTA
jgi:hypothetical protein